MIHIQERLIQAISPIDVCLGTQKQQLVTNLTKQCPDELINCPG
jgi:hypothetical protein